MSSLDLSCLVHPPRVKSSLLVVVVVVVVVKVTQFEVCLDCLSLHRVTSGRNWVTGRQATHARNATTTAPTATPRHYHHCHQQHPPTALFVHGPTRTPQDNWKDILACARSALSLKPRPSLHTSAHPPVRPPPLLPLRRLQFFSSSSLWTPLNLAHLDAAPCSYRSTHPWSAGSRSRACPACQRH